MPQSSQKRRGATIFGLGRNDHDRKHPHYCQRLPSGAQLAGPTGPRKLSEAYHDLAKMPRRLHGVVCGRRVIKSQGLVNHRL